MEREKLNKFLVSKKLEKRMKTIFFRSVNIGEFDDFLSDYRLHLLEGFGHRQTLDQFRIDWIRKKCGRNGSKIIYESELFEKDISVRDSCGDDYDNCVSKLLGYERTIFILSFKYGLTLKEIGDVFALSESRVSLLMKDIGSKIAEENN